MNSEKIKALYLQCVLYKMVAWGFILWIPSAKIMDCSPAGEIKYVLAAIFMDFYSLITLGLALVLFYLGKKAGKLADRLSEDRK